MLSLSDGLTSDLALAFAEPFRLSPPENGGGGGGTSPSGCGAVVGRLRDGGIAPGITFVGNLEDSAAPTRNRQSQVAARFALEFQ